MFSDKLLSLLLSFSRQELNRFRKFLISPYFNEQEELVQLFDLVNQTLRRGQESLDELDKTAVWKALFPGKPVDDADLRRLASELTRLALRFLAEESRQNDPMQEWLEQQKMLEKPELKKHLAGVERHMDKWLEDMPGKTTWHYLARFRMDWNIYNRASKVLASSGYMDKLMAVDSNMEVFYVVQKLKLYVSWLIFRGFRAAEGEMPVIPGFWDHLKHERFADIPLIGVYRYIIGCLTDQENEQHFRDLLMALDQHAGALNAEDLRECYQTAQNYCAFKINQGRSEYYREMFEIFGNMISRNILLEDGQLSEGVYKNVITVSLRVGEFAWAEGFIREYSTNLPSNIRENAQSFNLANLYSHQKRHDKVIELLRNVEYSDVTYALSAKLILVRTYFESGEWMALDSLIDSFRIYLRRNQVMSKSAKTEFINFLGFVKKLAALPERSSAAAAKIKAQIERCSSVSSKKWLLEKAGEM